MSSPLAGIRIIELATYISGPFAGGTLSDLGADVVKVEAPGGDPVRRFGHPRHGMSPHFANINRGKRSICLDLKQAGDRESLLTLLADADVLICNWRPGVQDRLGLADEVLVAANRRLIRLYMSGFGATGRSADRPVFDSIVQARAGLTEVQGRGERPELATTYLADKIAAILASQAILAAIVARQRTGRAERIDLSMLDAVAYFTFPDGGANRTFLADHELPARNDVAAAVRPLRAGDGWIVIAPVTSEQIRRLCTAVELDVETTLAERNPLRLLQRLLDCTEQWTRRRTLEECLRTMVAHDVPAATCLTFDEHLLDPDVVESDLYSVVEWPRYGLVRQIRYPALFDQRKLSASPGPAPAVGEHTAELLGLAADDLGRCAGSPSTL